MMHLYLPSQELWKNAPRGMHEGGVDSRGLRGEGVCIGFVRSGRHKRSVFVRELTILCIAWLTLKF